MSSVALVTGGGRGIGEAMATALARDGWRVAVASRTAHELQAALAEMPDSIAVTSDVSDEAQVCAMVAEAQARLGPIDLLVNNAVGMRRRRVVAQLRSERERPDAMQPLGVAGHDGTPVRPHRECRQRRGHDGDSTHVGVRHGEDCADPAHRSAGRGSEAVWHQRYLRWSRFEQIFREGRDVTPEPATRLLMQLASGDCDAQSGHFFCIPADDLGVLRTTAPLPS